MNRREALKSTALFGGVTLLTTSMLPILQSCQTETRSTWTPVFLDADQAQLVSALVDTILPQTATPGGLDVKVDMFIDRVFASLYKKEDQQKVQDQLTEFNEKSQSEFGKLFHKLDSKERVAMLTKEEAHSPKFNPGIWGTAIGKQKPVGFYRSFKSMAIWGYCTSEEISKNVLAYDPIPGDYKGCIPFSEVGKVWSL